MQSGHALAAAAEGVPCTRMAVFLMLCLPGAFVELDDESLAALTPWRVLRVCPVVAPCATIPAACTST